CPENAELKTLYWSTAEALGSEKYNEAFLAELRNEIKDNESQIFFIPRRKADDKPFWGSPSQSSISQEIEFFEQFTACMVHVARRLKDCQCICGFALPDFKNDWIELNDTKEERIAEFIRAFQKKHSRYIFINA
ncbi:MAG: hypothetical protein R3Y36_09130, partial [Spirochaetales bacterium]